MSVLNTLRNKLYSTTSQYFSHATLVEGFLKGTDQKLRCLFVENSGLQNIIINRAFRQSRILKRRKLWIPALRDIVETHPEGTDLCIAVLPKSYEKEFRGVYNFKSQENVRQIIDVSGTWEEVRSRFHHRKRQISNTFDRKAGLSYRISHDLKDFEFFYHRMYIPHLKKQFGGLAYVDSYDEMKDYLLKGFLLLVQEDGCDVTGALCLIENNTLIIRRAGVLDGDERYIKSGAQHALYYFNMLYAKQQGIEKVDTMTSLSFLADGVYRTKREWGAAVYPDDESKSWVFFFIFQHSEKIVSFFENLPVIIHTPAGLAGLSGWKGAPALPAVDKMALNKKYRAPGLEELILLTHDPERIITMQFQTYTEKVS